MTHRRVVGKRTPIMVNVDDDTYARIDAHIEHVCKIHGLDGVKRTVAIRGLLMIGLETVEANRASETSTQ